MLILEAEDTMLMWQFCRFIFKWKFDSTYIMLRVCGLESKIKYQWMPGFKLAFKLLVSILP